MDFNNQLTESRGYKQLLFIDKVILALYFLYFIMNPFYFWKSGLPQIADFILVASIILFLFRTKFTIYFNKETKAFLSSGLYFVVWILFVNLIGALMSQIISGFLTASLFYLYNFIVMVFVVLIVVRYGDKVYKNTFYAVVLSLTLQIIIYFIEGGYSGGRNIGSFNNPNQLGYYSLLMLAFILYLTDDIPNSFKWTIFGIFSSVILLFSSLSKAATVSLVGLLLFYFITKSTSKRLKRNIFLVTVIFFLAIGIIYNTTDIIQNSRLLNAVQERLNGIGNDNDDSLGGRGYDRIYKYPEYWLFGAGEGDLTRFNTRGLEFHSTLGNIQVSYGIVGSALFWVIMLLALKNDRFKSWYIIFFLMSYGLTHNGIRNRLLWILLALIATKSYMETIKSEPKGLNTA